MNSIPRAKGLPFIGQSYHYIKDVHKIRMENFKQFGPIYYTNFLGTELLVLVSPESAKLVLQDPKKIFSSQLGWKELFGDLFDHQTFAMQDFANHKRLRSFFLPFFSGDGIPYIQETINSLIHLAIANLDNTKPLLAYPFIRKLNLELATAYVLDIKNKNFSEQFYLLYEEIVYASTAFLRYRIPGTRYKKGIKSKQKLKMLIIEILQSKSYGKDSMVGRLITNNTANMSYEEIASHIIFILFAAHDTTSSTLINALYELVRNPHWQEKIRLEIYHHLGERISFNSSDFRPLITTDVFIKEVLRLYPPLGRILRTNLQPIEIHGYYVPKFTKVCINPRVNHMIPAHWSYPEKFLPPRFLNTDQKTPVKLQPWTWIPYRGGAHMCLGMHIADFQLKSFLSHLLRVYKIQTIAPLETFKFQQIPFIKPKNDLPLLLDYVSF